MANGSSEQLHPLQNTWCIWEHKVRARRVGLPFLREGRPDEGIACKSYTVSAVVEFPSTVAYTSPEKHAAKASLLTIQCDGDSGASCSPASISTQTLKFDEETVLGPESIMSQRSDPFIVDGPLGRFG